MKILRASTLLTVIVGLICAGSATVIDDFEDGDLSEYSGDTGQFSAASEASYSGSYGLGHSSDQYQYHIYSQSGLPTYPKAGDRISYRFYFDSVDSYYHVFKFGRQDSNNLYSVKTNLGAKIELKTDGTTVAEAPSNVKSDQWYRNVIEWNSDGNITVKTFNSTEHQIAFLNMTDSTYTQGGIGFGHNDVSSFGEGSGIDIYTDDVKVLSGSSSPSIKGSTPSNTNKDSSSGVDLSLTVEDNESDKMNITFYDASDNSQIGKVENVENGTYSVNWNGLSSDQTYNWYAEVTDGSSTVTSSTYSFTTIDIDLSWNDNSDSEDGFRIYSNASGTFHSVGTVGSSMTSFTDTNKNLEFGKHTCYRVKSYNSFGESSPATGCVTP